MWGTWRITDAHQPIPEPTGVITGKECSRVYRLTTVTFPVIHSFCQTLPGQGLVGREQDVLSPLAVILSVKVALPSILITSSTHFEFLQKHVPKCYKSFIVRSPLTPSLLVWNLGRWVGFWN